MFPDWFDFEGQCIFSLITSHVPLWSRTVDPLINVHPQLPRFFLTHISRNTFHSSHISCRPNFQSMPTSLYTSCLPASQPILNCRFLLTLISASTHLSSHLTPTYSILQSSFASRLPSHPPLYYSVFVLFWVWRMTFKALIKVSDILFKHRRSDERNDSPLAWETEKIHRQTYG